MIFNGKQNSLLSSFIYNLMFPPQYNSLIDVLINLAYHNLQHPIIFIIFIHNHHKHQMNFSEGLYTIKSKHAGRVLDVCQDTDRRGMLIIYDSYGGPNQQFYLRPNGVEVQIVSKQSGKPLTVSANSSKNGAPIFQQPSKGLDGQRFRIQEVSSGSGEFIIYTFCGKVLDCCEASKSNGTKIIQWEFNGGENQKWTLKKQ